MKTKNSRDNIAVLDIGKTHAKVILFDAIALKELAVFQSNNNILQDSLYPHFDVESLKAFIIRSLSELSKKFSVDSIFTSTHGACMALMSKGKLALPVLDYEFQGPNQIKQEYDEIRPNFSQTGTPRMDAGLNLGAQLYWQNKFFSDDFSKVDQILFWPQFWSYWLSGIAASEISYASSHSDLWDIKKKKFIDLNTYGVASKVKYPTLRSAATILGPLRKDLAHETGLPKNVPVYCGAHDSSLALVSASLNQPSPCTILSTGTWVTLFALGSNKTDIREQPGLMISCDCFGSLVPNFRFPAGKIYENLMQKQNKNVVEGSTIEASDVNLTNFENAEKAQLIYKHSNLEINFQDINTLEQERVISQILANQTLIGSEMIGAEGPMICSGPFVNNQVYLNTIKQNWSSNIFCEDDHLGLCKGIASLVKNKI
jgi:sugar (pentulose or hexulose) kinase